MGMKTDIYRHVVLFQFNDDVPDATVQSIEAAFRALGKRLTVQVRNAA